MTRVVHHEVENNDQSNGDQKVVQAAVFDVQETPRKNAK